MSESPPAEGFHSPDGLWWWNGASWKQALSWDGRYWFDGREWVDRPGRPVPFRSSPGWMLGLCTWLLLLIAWEPATVAVAWTEGKNFTRDALLALVVSGVVAVLATIIWGALLGARRRWQPLWWSTALGTGALLFTYAVIMVVSASPQDNTADQAAGAGAAIAVVPLSSPSACCCGRELGSAASPSAEAVAQYQAVRSR